MSRKETVVHIFKDGERNITACRLDDSENISLNFCLPDIQLTPLHLLNMALGQCLVELTLRFLERRDLRTTCLMSICTAVKTTGAVRIDGINITLTLPLQLSPDDKVILIRMLHQCPIHAAITGSVSITLQICDDCEAISYYEQNLSSQTSASISHVHTVSDNAIDILI
ncbi:OsmC family protein [Acidithiobacillus ferridurans]|uniref:OsmC family protein n=1 Tax=Acidithiobacillus ferridurans TaxID=1232575 RepID=UPI001C070FCB|nr:hypothetical protein [Acidithiobacillus ferridurans]MBU2733053.1 hypothetical protein [Acidithiobacillus ferridurans]